MAKVRREWGSITKRGRRYYVRYVDADGRKRWKVAGDRKRDAVRKLEQLRHQVNAQRAGHVRRELTLVDWWDEEYCAVLVSRLEPGGVGTARSNIQALCDWLHDERDDPVISAVTRGDAEAFVAAMFGRGLEPSYVRRVVSTLRRAWADAMARGLALTNVWSRMKMRPPRSTEVPWIEPRELAAIYEALPAAVRPHLVLVGETGLRIGEALALRRSDIDLERGHPRISVRKGKTPAARRTIPLGPRAVEVLRPLLERPGRLDARVLPPRGGESLRRALTVACAAAGVQRITPHKLRHVYASHLVQAGVAPTTVAAILGHSDGGALVLRLYGRWMPQDAQHRAVEILAGLRDVEPAEHNAVDTPVDEP